MFTKALGKSIGCCADILVVVWLLWMWPHSSDSFISINWVWTENRATTSAYFLVCPILFIFQPIYTMQLISWQKFFLRESLDTPWLKLSLWKGVWSETYLTASVRDLKLAATAHGHCLYFRNVFLMTFQLRFFSLFTPVWRADIWISGGTFGIYTEENILFTESESLKKLLSFP